MSRGSVVYLIALAFLTPRYNIFTYEGSDEPWVAKSGRMQDNVFSDNTISGGDESIKLKEADGTEFTSNTFKDAKTIRFVDCEDTLMSSNTGLKGVEQKVEDACFDGKSDSDDSTDYRPTC